MVETQSKQFQVNQGFKLQVIKVGQEQTPVIIIDDFGVNCDAVKNYACQQGKFDCDASSYYPGVRTPLPKPYVISVLNAVYKTIYQVYNIPPQRQLQPQNYYFSLISHQPEQLKSLQRMPHFDTLNPYYFAILHYLNDGPHGDTGLFRHIPSGFERINPKRSDDYFSAAQHHVNTYGQPKPGYFVESDQQYYLYEQLRYRANRLVIYPGNLLHSVIVNNDTDIDDNPQTGRLTANIFVDFVAP
ncbi:DUF6445 family protein [Shewanella waksmanii]|uniref:DUF6445 family protein n=1 Tax=Shewanella waksmanii TaxID=213783 RepID=UPI0004B25D2D|nr:DUF6445 family protein [Shewanella waksmanii]